jgi:uncharacterized membrane protein YeaQ/YmgE (transglycosylase-associated protein family)
MGHKGWIEVALDYGFSVVFFIAGVFGALASLLKQREMTFTERLVTILSGGGTAAYITPMVVETVGLSQGSSYGMAFVVGFAGLKIVEWMIAAIRDRLINSNKP